MTFAAPLLALLVLNALEVRLQPGVARPGDIVLVELSGAIGTPRGKLGSIELDFLPFGSRWIALVALPVSQKAGKLGLAILGSIDGGQAPLGGELEVRQPHFRRRRLSVNKRFTRPSQKERQQMRADNAAFGEAFARDLEPWIFKDAFIWPRPSQVTAPFGDLRLINNQKRSQHQGADLDGATGAPLFAANDGEVVLMRACFSSGNTLLLHHGGRLFTAYFHLSAFAVRQGERVKRGQLLGEVGKTGRVTGPHLHFGVKLDDRWVDPESLLRLEFPSDPSTSPDASPRTPPPLRPRLPSAR